MENPIIKKLVTSQSVNDLVLEELRKVSLLTDKIDKLKFVSDELKLKPLEIIVEGEFLDMIIDVLDSPRTYENNHSFLERE